MTKHNKLASLWADKLWLFFVLKGPHDHAGFWFNKLANQPFIAQTLV